MNLSAIKAICFGGKRATIYNEPFWGQWISNGFGAYLVEGVKLDSPEALMELWNLSNKARGKAAIFMEKVDDHRFTVDVWPGEEQLEELSGITWGDNDSYIALKSVHCLLWIYAPLLKPLRSDYRQYYARWEGGKPLIAVYENMADGCKALILPTGNQMADSLQHKAEKLRAFPYHWPDAEAEAAQAEAEAERMLNRNGGGEDEPEDEQGE